MARVRGPARHAWAVTDGAAPGAAYLARVLAPLVRPSKIAIVLSWPSDDNCRSIRSPRPNGNGSPTIGAAQASAMAVVTSIMRLQQIFLSKADATLRPLELTFARYEVLMLLSFSKLTGYLPLGVIGERLQVNAASVTNAINRLEARGLVERRPNPQDGRGTLAAPEPGPGRQLAQQATETHE